MAIHQKLEELSADAIDEYIKLARMGFEFEKPNSGCLGYPSTLLLFCTVDALSNHLGFPEHSLGALNHKIFGLNLTADQIKNLKLWYRHLLAHNAMIAPGTVLTSELKGDPIEFVKGEPVKIRIGSLLELVEQAWKAFDKTTMKPRKTKQPKAAADYPGGSTSIVVAASSACIVPAKITKL